MTRSVLIKFDPKFTDPILDGSKTATLRLDWDRPVRPADDMVMNTPDGRTFAVAEAKAVRNLTAMDAVAMDIDGHESYRDMDYLARELGGYYGWDDIDPNTELTLIRWSGAKDPHRLVRWERPQGVSL